MTKSKIIIILGPTATGKTKLGIKLAAKFDGEIISADSRQVYQGMDIGTGKDLQDYYLEIPKSKLQITNKFKIQNPKFKTLMIPYHLIDIVSPKTEFNVAKWLNLTHKAIADIHKRGKVPIVVGGAGLYISALVCGYNLAGAKPDKSLRKKLNAASLPRLLARLKKLDSITYKKIDKKNKRRTIRALEICLQTKKPASTQKKTTKPNYDFLILGAKKSRKQINELADKRVDKRLKQGMIEEIERLHKQGVSWKRLDDFGLEYRWISKYLREELSRKEMVEKLKIATHQFVKRQMMWFKRMERVRWVKNYQTAEKLATKFLQQNKADFSR